MLADNSPLTTREQLTEVFRASEKPAEQFRVGVEAEKFVVDRTTFQPMPYAGPRGAEGLFSYMSEHFGWSAKAEVPGGPPISLEREGASITLEPGAQFELSGAPHFTLAQVEAELVRHNAELKVLQDQFDLAFLHVGFHPWAKHADLPWVPKRRYPIMKSYLPTRGSRGVDMMLRTATVQVNLDYSSEHDAMLKLVTLSRLTPLLRAAFLNSPFIEGARGERLGERLDVWLNMDPARSGVLEQLWTLDNPRYADYAEWALDAGMFLFTRDGQVVANTGQTFRAFMRDGFEGHRATPADWKLHLGTLFPEIRLKNTLEIRFADTLPAELAMSLPALLVGLSYDPLALEQARELAAKVSPVGVGALHRAVAVSGLATPFDGGRVRDAVERLIDIAAAGLARLAPQAADARYLEPLQRLVAQGQTPAELLIADWGRSGKALQEFLVARFSQAGD
ncbi:MAG: hypothetical protein RJA70_316 [Pseudomonadota bacterium]|jgi:glutamate--cysteine ligase